MKVKLRKTPLNDRHRALGATMVDFAGWEMPVRYPSGIIGEHRSVRTHAGLFDVSHMGRFAVDGAGALDFLRHALTNDAARLSAGLAHYTLLADEAGRAIDDAYLYRLAEDEFLLVVNAANRERDLAHLEAIGADFRDVGIRDVSARLSMLALAGPAARSILEGLGGDSHAHMPPTNRIADVRIGGLAVRASGTGYTGESLSFELFVRSEDVPGLWDMLVGAGAAPTGLGARNTLRLEAALPLYGHEYGTVSDGSEIPILANRAAWHGVDLSPRRNDFLGRRTLLLQREALETQERGARVILPVAVMGRSAARAGDEVFTVDGLRAGCVTSGSVVPYVRNDDQGPSDNSALRLVALVLVERKMKLGTPLAVEIRGRVAGALVVPFHLRRVEGNRTRAVVYRRAQGEGEGDALYCEY